MALSLLRPLPRVALPSARFTLDELSGRLVELRAGPATGGGALTCAFGLVLEAQQRAEPVAYVGDVACGFHPADAAQSGVDLEALVVVRTAAQAARGRAADELLRSGAFGLVIIDLVSVQEGDRRLPLAPGMISRLLGLAQKHHSAVVFLTSGPDADETGSPLGSLISLRAAVTRRLLDDGRHVVSLRAVKDKRAAPGWTHEEICRGPAGTC